MQITFNVFGWEITLMLWVGLAPILGGCISRLRKIDPIPALGHPGEVIDMAYAEAYCPVGGIAIEVWNYDKEDGK